MNTYPNKTKLRAEVRAQRHTMSRQEVESASAVIHQRVSELTVWREAETICAYLSLGNEVATHELVMETLGTKTILVPRSHDDGLMSWHRLHDWEALVPGMYGILEPPATCARSIRPPRPCLSAGAGL